MTSKQLQLFIVLDKVGIALSDEISKKMSTMNRPMAPIEMHQVLEDFKKQVPRELHLSS